MFDRLRRSIWPLICVGFMASGCDASDDGDAGGSSGSETGQEACAERPAYPELYSSCAGAASCGVSGYACASQTGMDPEFNQAFCTKSCYQDSECPAVGDCGATPVCVAPNGGQGACGLDCADGRQCPNNMMCLSDLDPNMPRDLCF